MKIALVNKYLYPKGGADVSNLQMAQLLKGRGHEVVLMGMAPAKDAACDYPTYLVSPVDYDDKLTPWERVRAAGRLLYSWEAKNKMLDLIRKEQPDIIHFNNIYHQLSPSVIDAAAACGIPTAMTLRDYKLTCSIYTHFREGKVCVECRGGRFYNTLRFRCTKGSSGKSLLNTMEMYLHRTILDTYHKVGTFISPSRFLKRKVRQLGFRAKIVYLPNCVNLEVFRPRYDWEVRQIAYFGRLSPEKGLFTLLDALKGLDMGLRLIGTGRIEAELREKVRRERIRNVHFPGFLTGAALRREVQSCMFTVLPSEWYENNPRSVLESFALGKPVIGSDIGGIPELIGEGRGLCFRTGNHRELRERMRTLANDPDGIRTMGRNARRYAEAHLSLETHYRRLMDIYRKCL